MILPTLPHVNDKEAWGWGLGEGDLLGLHCQQGAEPRLAASSPTQHRTLPAAIVASPSPAHTLALSPAHTWASCSSGSSDVEPLVWTLPLDSLVSMRAGELGFEDAGAPFGRACSGKQRHQGLQTLPAAHHPVVHLPAVCNLLSSVQKPCTLGNFTTQFLL